jgi:outer membrane protein OmpA-like peptidoglycan-associated protein
MTDSIWRRCIATALALLVGACAGLDAVEPTPKAAAANAPGAPSAAAPGQARVPAPAPAPPPDGPPGPLAPVPLDAAVQRAAERLFSDAQAALGDVARELVIDPLIDARTGLQTTASVAVGAQLTRLIAEKYPRWTVQPLTRQSLSPAPLLLLGSLTPVDLNPVGEGSASPVDAFALWLTLADLRTGKVIAKRLDRALPASVNAEPTRFHRDVATPLIDGTTTAYLRAAQVGTGAGDPLDPLYAMRLPAAAVINEAINAYNANQLGNARRLFADAARLAAADDLRVLNGLHLSAWRLGHRQEAGEAIARIVSGGLAKASLELKILFEPGSTKLLGPANQHAQYRLWLREVAQQAGARRLCLRVIGHASRSADAAAAQAQALRRAAVVRWMLAGEAPAHAKRFSAGSVGWSENLLGLATDDARDALDRRIELRVVGCS